MTSRQGNDFPDNLWRPMTQHAAPHPSLKKKFVRAEGCYLYDENGQEYLDAFAGLLCVNVGYGRKELAEIAAESIAKLSYISPVYASDGPIALADRIAGLLGQTGEVFFSSSGSEANETAFKIARQYHLQSGLSHSHRHKIISRHRAYHGNTAAALAATGQADRKTGYEPLAPGFLHVMPPYSYRAGSGITAEEHGLSAAQAFEEAIIHEGPDSVAAIIMEPIMSGGGILIPPDSYLPTVREICDRYGVLLIFDEVVSGFGRTGKMFGFEHWGIYADIYTFAKGLSSGYFPIAATFVRDRIFNSFLGKPEELKHFRQINTFGGHPVAADISMENLNIVEREGLLGNAQSQGDWIRKQLIDEIGDHHNVGEIRGIGLMIGIELVEDKNTKLPIDGGLIGGVISKAFDANIIIGRNGTTIPGHSNVVILAPPLTLTRDEAARIVNVLISSIKALPRK